MSGGGGFSGGRQARWRRLLWVALVLAAVALVLAACGGDSGVTVRMSAIGFTVPANDISGINGVAISEDGRFVAFASAASNLVTGDTNKCSDTPTDKRRCLDVFVRDRVAGTTERVSVSSAGAQANGDSVSPTISADGRFVAFESRASNLVADDTDRCGSALASCSDVFVRDRVARTTRRVSVSSTGAPANGDSGSPTISADGRFVAFVSGASKLVVGHSADCGVGEVSYSCPEVFVRDRVAGRTELASVSSSGVPAKGAGGPAISADGRFVAFTSNASNLVAGDTNKCLERTGLESTATYSCQDVFLHDRVAGTTTRVSVSSAGAQANGDSGTYGAAISANGRFVAFESTASNLVAGDTKSCINLQTGEYSRPDVFVHDRVNGTTERISVSGSGVRMNTGDPAYSGCDPFQSAGLAISADGRFVAFTSGASNLVRGDTNREGLDADVFVRDRRADTTDRVSVSSAGAQARGSSEGPAISADSRVVAFASYAPNLVAHDMNKAYDVFVRDRTTNTTTLVSVGQAWAPQAGQLVLQPWPAQAGKQLTATMPILAGGGQIADAKVACTATLFGRKLSAPSNRFSASNAICAWRIPQTARGTAWQSATLEGSVSALTPGGLATMRFAGTVQ
jgi:Tol biopolymer transport system component